MGLLIDTSVLVGHERGRIDLDRLFEERLAGRTDEPYYISVITVSELLHGVHRARDRTRRARRSAFVEGVLDAFPVLPIDVLTARTHAELGAGLADEGTRIGTHDLWDRGGRRGRGLGLVTLNLRDFRRIPGLEVEDWG